MIAEAPDVTRPPLVIVQREKEPEREISVSRVVGTLQLLLAARRMERTTRK